MTCGQDRSICLWNPARDDMKDGFLIKRYKGPHSNSVNDVSVAPDNQTFVSGGEEREVYLWDVTNAKVLRRFYGHSQRINTVCYNPEGSVIASGSYDTTVKLWDTKSHSSQCIQTLSDAADSITSICMDDTSIVTGSVDGTVRSYDIRMGKLYEERTGVPICSVSLSKDNQCIVASTTSSSVLCFERASGLLLNEYRGHICEEYKIESILNNTDEYIITGSENGKVYFYDLISTKVHHTLEYHDKPISSIRQHPENRTLLVASFDGIVSVWD
ncbi:hypothetical protein WA538_003580, partial [Blastocystis sp. DL]